MYGAYVALLLPALLATAIQSRGVRRLFWLGGFFVSAVALLLTVSRGAYVAIAVASVWAAALLRPYISLRKIMMWSGAALGLIMVLLAIVSVRYGDLLAQRLSTGIGGDVETLSSGRTAIWWHAISRMLQAPISLVTGFGWHAYEAMPFRHSTHNYYLWLWFNMGVVGVIAGVLLFAFLVRRARRAVGFLPPQERPTLIAFVAGTLAYAVASFFVDLYSPWIWYSIYAGLAMRISVSARWEAPQREATPVARAVPAAPKHDPFGWVGSTR
jgi:O-antigen ligase